MNDVAIVGVVVDREEVGHQLGDVLAADAEGGEVDRYDIQPVVEILAEILPRYLIEEFAVTGGDHPGIDRDRLGVTHPFELTLLEDAEEFHLQLRRGGIDLVEEDRAGVGRFEPAGPVGDGAGERAADVAEQFTLQQAL